MTPLTPPISLRAWAFSSDLAAQRAVRRLAGSPRTAPSFDDLAVVCWPADQRRPLAWQARELSGDRRLSGAFWGLLFAHLFLIPISLGAAPSPTADHLDDALGAIGVDADFVDTVRDRIVPGTSALFLLDTTAPATTSAWPPTDAVHLADLRLTAEQSDRLHAGFDDE
ncbi:MAG TPA: DUF1269 domain-containing protein [Microlunatus sp.]